MTQIADSQLSRELKRTIAAINDQITEVMAEADRMDTPVRKLKLSNGDWALAPLLVAKAQSIHALVLFNDASSRRRT